MSEVNFSKRSCSEYIPDGSEDDTVPKAVRTILLRDGMVNRRNRLLRRQRRGTWRVTGLTTTRPDQQQRGKRADLDRDRRRPVSVRERCGGQDRREYCTRLRDMVSQELRSA